MLAQTASSTTKPEKMVTNSYAEVKKSLQDEKDNELVHPSAKNENKKDVAPETKWRINRKMNWKWKKIQNFTDNNLNQFIQVKLIL